jgi:MFS transporter, DHA1 family, tetracycline resistance protein
MEKKKSPLLVIFLVVFFDLLSFGIVIPILPYYSREFGANGFVLGWLMASFSIAQFLFSPFWGSLSDRWGRRPVLLLTILGSSCAMAATALADSLPLLFLCRFLAGFFAANISTATAYIADVTDEKSRAKGMGIIGAGFGLGFIFGPAIGGLLSPYGYSVPILVAAVLAFLNFCFAYFVLVEPTKHEKSTSTERWKKDAWLGALTNKATAIPIGLFFLHTFAFTQLEVIFGLYVLESFGLNAQDAGWLLAGMGLVSATLQGGLIGRLSAKFGEKNLVLLGFILMAVALLGSGLAPVVGFFSFFLIFVALGMGLTNPSLSSLASKGAAAHERGRVMGIYQSAGSLSRVIGPPLAGLLFDQVHRSAPILLASTLMMLAALGTFFARRKLL